MVTTGTRDAAKQVVRKLLQQNKLLVRASTTWTMGPQTDAHAHSAAESEPEPDPETEARAEAAVAKQLRALRKQLEAQAGPLDEFEFARHRRRQTKRFSIDLSRVNNKHKLLAKEQRIAISELAKREAAQTHAADFRMDLSFSGAGFMGCYYFGVVNCWNKYIPFERVSRVAGASAGALIAAYYLLELPLDRTMGEIIDMLEQVRARPLGVFDRGHQLVDILPKRLAGLFPEEAHKLVNGRLFVSLTRLRDMKSVIVNEFESKRDLIEALNCSCFIPLWSGNHVPSFRGTKYIDGGFSNNQPVFDEHTIRVCCFSGASDVAPSDGARLQLLQGSMHGMPFHLSWSNLRRARRALWPPPAAYVVGLLERGFHDTKHFILSHDLIQCDACFAGLQRAGGPGAAPAPAEAPSGDSRAPSEPPARPATRRASQAAVSPSEKFFGAAVAQRRNTRAQLDTSRLVELAGRRPSGDCFSQTSEPLPSCPPSPNLNRQCAACARLRQAARADAVDEAVREQAQKHLGRGPAPEAGPGRLRLGVRRGLAGPVRWVRRRLLAGDSYALASGEPRAQRRRSLALAETLAH